MTNDQELKKSIETALNACANMPLAEAAIALFDVLGYRSEKRLSLKPNTPENFLRAFAKDRPLNRDQAILAEWQSVDFLFQLTDDEVRAVALGDQSSLFESSDQYEGAILESYLFFALELEPRTYTRTELSGITRAVNRLFSMPVFLLFRHGDTATLAIIRRRLHKRDESKDVLEKVTLIKDIALADPIRAHIEILYDLALPVLFDEYRFHNFIGLHNAWEKRLESYALNVRFYREVAAWYFWAMSHKGVTLPRAIEELRDKEEREKQRSVFFIRLLTRLIFCWFLQEKRLIPRDLFRKRVAEDLLKDSSPKAGTYYRAFLQNLFFGTLNQEQDKRDWRKEYEKSTRKGNRGATNLWRYRDLLQDSNQLESLLRDLIPFVNGGLFDCLDQVFQEKEGRQDIRLDDFSEEKGNALRLPNELFFGGERELDLSEVYDDQRRKREKVRGLIDTLSRYKFTVEENTPLEEEIALDPELLGKVFENLLASYNEDTRTTARKALGGFYTPREIVNYMVDEALIAYLQTAIDNQSESRELESRLRSLFRAHAVTFNNHFDQDETAALIAAIGRVKILDPACGSGAFPMGTLHRLVDLLQKLDPNNESWKRDRLAEAERYRDILRQSDASRVEVNQYEARIEDIRKSFDKRYHALDFARKLYIIENSIYGVDIQPIATQIAKLRFFIALIVDQQVSPAAPNLGVRPLPNLETKIVAANALIPLEKADRQMDLLEMQARPLRRQLEQVRHDHFNARTPSAKARCRLRDAELRMQLADLLRKNGLPADEARTLATWDPYDQNHAAEFFDSEWMFGISVGPLDEDASTFVDRGFDVVMGNPPYGIRFPREEKQRLSALYPAARNIPDSYCFFILRALSMLRQHGSLTFIVPNTFCDLENGETFRRFILKASSILSIWQSGWAFSEAVVDTLVLHITRGDPKTGHRFRVIRDDQVTDKDQAIFLGRPLAKIDFRSSEQSDFLLQRILNHGELISSFCTVKAGVKMYELGKGDPPQTAKVVKERLYSVRGECPPGWKPLYRGADIAPFELKVPEESVNYGKWLAAPRSPELFEPPKILMRRTDDQLRSALDTSNAICVNSCHVIKIARPAPDSGPQYRFVLAVLNSRVCQWAFEQSNPQMVGKTFAEIKVVYVERLPVPPASAVQRALIALIVDYLVWLKKHFQLSPESTKPRDPTMVAYWEQLLNGLIYELFFPEELYVHGLHLFDLIAAAALPDLGGLSKRECASRLRFEFERLYATEHPLRGALSILRSLETIRIIEGEQ